MNQHYARLFSLFTLTLLLAGSLSAQLESVPVKVLSRQEQLPAPDMSRRSVAKPTQCNVDTSQFVAYGNKGLRFVTLRSGSSLGQFFGAPQTLTIHGFRVHAIANAVTPARKVFINLRCNLYRAGLDSLPTGSPLASDTITVDTVMRAVYPSDIQFDAVFSKAVTLNYGYVLVVECDSTTVTAALLTNDWTLGDGRKRNLGCGSVSGKWYRNLQLNVGGVLFDADAQLYPFVSYKFGTDFTITNQCYNSTDTVRFQNLHKNNVSSSVYYNYYQYYNLSQFSHRWSYDNKFGSTYVVDGKYKPASRKNFDVRLISTVYQYRTGQCNDTVVKTVYFRPVNPVLKRPAAACKGDTVDIEVNYETAARLRWYRRIGDTAFHTGGSLRIANAQQDDSFFVRVENGPCNSGYVKIMFRVYDYPDDPVVSNDSVCQGAAANLQVSATKGEVGWFTNSSGGAPVFKGQLMQTDKLYRDTTFYVEVNKNGCLNKGGRVAITAFVGSNYAPKSPAVVADTFACYSPGASFTFSASGDDTIRWFDVPSGGVAIAKGPDLTVNPSGRGVYDYYVEVWNGVCASSREHAILHVYQPAAIGGKTNPSVCAGDSVSFALSQSWGHVDWYDRRSGGNLVYTGLNPVFRGLTANTTYYLESAEEGCRSASRDSVRVTVNTPPTPTLTRADPVCSKGIGTFQVNAPGGQVWWYYEDTSSVPFYQGNTVKTSMLLSNMTYYYATEKNGCYSERKPLTITVRPRPAAGFTWSVRWKYQLICTPIATSGLNFEWFWGDGTKTNGLPGVHQYSGEGSYTVRLIVTSTANGCKDTADIPVVISHVGRNAAEDSKATVFPVPATAGSLVNIGTAADVHYTLYNMAGIPVVAGVSDKDRILLPVGIAAGHYVLVLETGPGETRRALLSIISP